MKKNLGLVAIVILVIAGITTGCREKIQSPTNTTIEIIEKNNFEEIIEPITIDIKQVMDDVIKHLSSSTLLDGTDVELESVYNIESTLLKNYEVKLPLTNTNSTEVAIFEINESTDVELIKEAINKRIETLMNAWEKSDSIQYELVKNNKVVIHDDYVLFVISEHADYIENIFKRAFDSTIPEIAPPIVFKEADGTIVDVKDESVVKTQNTILEVSTAGSLQ